MKRTPVYITVRTNGDTEISGYPDGFPVDGDALQDRMALKKRAQSLIASDPDLLAAARAWLGRPLDRNDPPLTPAEVARLVSQLYPGGPGRFISTAPTFQKVLTP